MTPATGAASEGSSRTRVVVRNSLWLSLDAVVSLVASLALSIAVARSLGPTVLGVYNYAMWLLSSAAAITATGVAYGMQQFAAERLGRGDLAGAAAVLRRGFRWQLALATLIVAAGATAVVGFAPSAFRVPLLIAVASIAPGLLVSVPAGGLSAAQEYSGNVFSSIAAVAVNVSLVSVALLSGWGLTGLTTALLLSRCTDLAARSLAWRRTYRALSRGTAVRVAAMSAGDSERMRRYAWRSSVLLLIDLVIWDRSEFVVLTHFTGLHEVAFYSLSFNIVQQALMLPKMLSWAIGANLLVERGRDPETATRLWRDAIRYVFFLAAPLTLGLAAIDRAILPLLYGHQYDDAIPVLTVIGGLAALRGAVVPVQQLLRMNEEQVFLIRFGVIMGLVNIALDLWLIPSGGAVGAAWANGIVQSLTMAGMTIYAARRLALRVPLADMARALAACVPMVVVARVLANLLPHWPAVLVAVPLGAALYGLSLKWLGAFREADEVRLASLDHLLPARLRETYRSALRWLAAPQTA